MAGLVDPFAVGMLLGLIIGGSVFSTAKIAAGVLTSVATACLGFAVVNDVPALQLALGNFLGRLGSNFSLVAGFLAGALIIGLIIAILRSYPHWWD